MEHGYLEQSGDLAWPESEHDCICASLDEFDGHRLALGEPIPVFKGIWCDGSLLTPRRKRRPNQVDEHLGRVIEKIVALGVHIFGEGFVLSLVQLSLPGVYTKGHWHRDREATNGSKLNQHLNLIIALEDLNEQQNAVTWIRTPHGERRLECAKGHWCAFDGAMEHCRGPNKGKGSRKMLLCGFRHSSIADNALSHRDGCIEYHKFLTRNRLRKYISFVLCGNCERDANAFSRHMSTFAETKFAASWTVVLYHDDNLPGHYLAFLGHILPAFQPIRCRTAQAERFGYDANLERFLVHDFPDAQAYLCCNASSGITAAEYDYLEALQSGIVDYVYVNQYANAEQTPSEDLGPVSVASFGLYRDKFSFDMRGLLDRCAAEFPDMRCDEFFLRAFVQPLLQGYSGRKTALAATPATPATPATQYEQSWMPLVRGGGVNGKFADFIQSTGYRGWEVEPSGQGDHMLLDRRIHTRSTKVQ